MDPIFTQDDLANPAKLLTLLGSHWTDFYPDQEGVLAEFLNAVAALAEDVERLTVENLDVLSWKTCPVFRLRGWYAWRFRRSDRDQASIPRFGDVDRVFGQGGLKYDLPGSQTAVPFPSPAGLVDCRLACSDKRLGDTVLSQGMDLLVDRERAVVWFRQDPEDIPGITKSDVIEDGIVVDREYVLWLKDSQWDVDLLQRQFGYVLGLAGPSGVAYRQVLQARMASLINGNNGRRLQGVIQAMTGVEFVQSRTETVEIVEQDARGLVIATDQRVYRFSSRANAIVAVGDVVSISRPLTDAVQIYEFNRGEVPDDLLALSVPEEFWGGYGEVVFQNKVVPLQVKQVAGKTYAYFSVGGFGKAVKDFWDTVHARGLEQGATLANLLDIRENPTDEPQSYNLPPTINPLKFLVEHFFRYHVFAVKIRTAALGRDVFIDPKAWRALVPAHTFGFLILEIEGEDSLVLDGPPTETSPGYEEEFSALDAMVMLDTAADSLVTETVSLTTGGVCPIV
jgi:hypothetical protein